MRGSGELVDRTNMITVWNRKMNMAKILVAQQECKAVRRVLDVGMDEEWMLMSVQLRYITGANDAVHTINIAATVRGCKL
jgi:hypothetical protein